MVMDKNTINIKSKIIIKSILNIRLEQGRIPLKFHIFFSIETDSAKLPKD